MGYLETSLTSKESLVRRLTDPARFSGLIITHSVVGNNLWKAIEVEENGKPMVVIHVDLMSSHKGLWGYKSYDEASGPNAVNCPQRILKLSTCDTGYAREWKERAWAYHQGKSQARKEINVGRLVFFGNEEYRLEHNLGRKGWHVIRTRDGMLFRMKANHLSQAIRNENNGHAQTRAWLDQRKLKECMEDSSISLRPARSGIQRATM